MTSIDRHQKNPHDDESKHPRPPAAFLPADGGPATVAEAMCLLVQAMVPHVRLDQTLVIGPSKAEREVTGAEVVAGVRHLLASGHDRSLLNELVLPRVMPHVETAVVGLGYTHLMILEEEAEK